MLMSWNTPTYNHSFTYTKIAQQLLHNTMIILTIAYANELQ